MIVTRKGIAGLALAALIGIPIVGAAANIPVTQPDINLNYGQALRVHCPNSPKTTSPNTTTIKVACPKPSPTPTAAPTPTPTPTVAPTPTPTVAPTPTPTVAPTPTPTAPPTNQCAFTAPAFTNTITVPSTLDSTGATNVAPTLNSLIASAPSGSIIDFTKPNAIYRLDAGLLLSGKTNLFLRGNNTTTLKMNGSGDDEALSGFLLRGSSHIKIDGFTVDGGYSSFPGQAGETAHGLGLSGWYGGPPSSYVELSNVNIKNIYGDGVYLEGENVGTQRPSSFICIHNNSINTVGRNGISFINVTDVDFFNNTVNRIAYHAVDLEPNSVVSTEDVRRITVRNNTFGSYAHRGGLLGYFVSVGSPGVNPSGWSDITIKNNTVAGISANGYDGRPLGLDSAFRGRSDARMPNVVFTGNSSPQLVSGNGILYFNAVDGLTVTGNSQPIQAGSTLVLATNSTNTTIGPNP